MKYTSLSIRTIVSTAAVLGILSTGNASEACAEENANLAIRETSKLPISAESLEDCTLATLDRIFFQYDQSALSPKEKATLDSLASRFSRMPESVIELRGYTDGMESAQYEAALGSKRSQAIADYLIARGVPSASILLVAIDRADDQDRSLNPEHRRVDVRVFTVSGSISAKQTRESVRSKAS
jgi:outer membrane protein OmpA-like peptidoglycan-associated protein